MVATKAKTITTKKAPAKTTVKKAAPKTAVKKTITKKSAIKKVTNASVELVKRITKILDDGKAQNIMTIDLMGKTPLADYLVIASGTSSRQVMALASTLSEKLKDMSIRPKMEGKTGTGEWIVLDTGDIIVHIFQPETRSFYEIETLWGKKTPAAE